MMRVAREVAPACRSAGSAAAAGLKPARAAAIAMPVPKSLALFATHASQTSTTWAQDLGGAPYQRLRLCSDLEALRVDRRLFARVHDLELRAAPRARARRGQKIEEFARPCSPKPDRNEPDADPEELQSEQDEDLRWNWKRRWQGQKHEGDGGSENVKKGRLPGFHLFAGLEFSGRLTATRTCCYGGGEMQGSRLILIALAGMAALLVPARASAQAPLAAVGTPDPCASNAPLGGGAAGCFWNASINLGPMPQTLYWHIDRFPDVASAEAVRSLYGRVIVAHGGQVFLQTVNDRPDWSSGGGERIGTVGPLIVPEGRDLTARFMELTLPAGNGAKVLVPSGPQAVILLDGALCIETPSGAQELESRGSAIVPTGLPAAPIARGFARALVLVVHPSAAEWMSAPSGWEPAGRCAP